MTSITRLLRYVLLVCVRLRSVWYEFASHQGHGCKAEVHTVSELEAVPPCIAPTSTLPLQCLEGAVRLDPLLGVLLVQSYGFLPVICCDALLLNLVTARHLLDGKQMAQHLLL